MFNIPFNAKQVTLETCIFHATNCTHTDNQMHHNQKNIKHKNKHKSLILTEANWPWSRKRCQKTHQKLNLNQKVICKNSSSACVSIRVYYCTTTWHFILKAVNCRCNDYLQGWQTDRHPFNHLQMSWLLFRCCDMAVLRVWDKLAALYLH